MYALGHGKFETLKHNSTSANLIPVGITYTNHKGMHRGLAQFWPSTSVQNQGCSCKFKLHRQLRVMKG